MAGDGTPALIEPIPIQDTFATGVHRVEIVGSCARFILYVDQCCPDGKTERVTVSKITMPLEYVPAAIRAAIDGTVKHIVRPISDKFDEALEVIALH